MGPFVSGSSAAVENGIARLGIEDVGGDERWEVLHEEIVGKGFEGRQIDYSHNIMMEENRKNDGFDRQRDRIPGKTLRCE